MTPRSPVTREQIELWRAWSDAFVGTVNADSRATNLTQDDVGRLLAIVDAAAGLREAHAALLDIAQRKTTLIFDDAAIFVQAQAALAALDATLEGSDMQAWDVYLNGKLIDTVFYDSDCSQNYVHRGLVEHDGYSPSIEVRKPRKETGR